MEYEIVDQTIPPVVERTSKELVKYLWSKTKKATQEDVDYFTDTLLELYALAQRDERIERRRVEKLKREKTDK